MSRISSVVAAVAITAALSTSLAAATLHDLEWRSRVLVVVAPDARSPALAMQDRLLAAHRDGLRDRDLSVIHVVGAAVAGVSDDAAALRLRLGVSPGAFAVRLIGKDGHVALRDAQPLPVARLFAAIDGMPMRRAEIARRGY